MTNGFKKVASHKQNFLKILFESEKITSKMFAD